MSFQLRIFVMIIIVVVPKQRLVTIGPGKRLCPNIHVGVLGAFVDRGHVSLMLPVFSPLHPGVYASHNKGGNDHAYTE